MLTLDADYGSSTFRTVSRSVPPVLVTAPTEEPVTVEEAMLQCGADSVELQSKFAEWIQAAREGIELDAEIALCTQTRRTFLDYFHGGAIELRMPPVQSVSGITYTDSNGTTQTLSASSYETDIYARPGLVIPSYGNYWPSVRAKLQSIAVTFVCGYGAASAVPKLLKQAILLQVASMYQDREMTDQETKSYEAIIAKFAWRRFI